MIETLLEHDVIWDVLLDERLSRHKKKNSTTTYLKNLREHLADEKVMVGNNFS